MSISIPSPLPSSPSAARSRVLTGRRAIPLSIYAVSLASLLTMVGILWDISWHRSIGRDKFLSPPHILVYLGAIFAGLFSGIQVLYTSFFRKEAAKATEVRVWGIFYSPLGSLFCIWGAIAMLTSAPFDDWWHNAYGLDVTILSPPHTLLAMGMIFLQFGACVGICKYLNADAAEPGAPGGRRSILQTLFVISALSLLTMVYTLFTDYLHIRGMRSGPFYIIATIVSLFLLPAFGRASRMKWGMTAVTGGYFLLVALSNWILQLFPAEPKLGPILTHVTHFQPANFPALVIVPAMAMDLVLQRSKAGDWVRALWLSIAFVGLLVAVQYPLSGFLLESPNSRNWFFTGNTYYFGLSPNWPWRYRFRPGDIAPLPKLLQGLAVAVLLGWVCARISLRWGRWMQSIQR
ncbi:MAG TPA: hypothetical protein VKQ52_18995 [Puia sp.]|nr:hypothetical protein [Puia sp.]